MKTTRLIIVIEYTEDNFPTRYEAAPARVIETTAEPVSESFERRLGELARWVES